MYVGRTPRQEAHTCSVSLLFTALGSVQSDIWALVDEPLAASLLQPCMDSHSVSTYHTFLPWFLNKFYIRWIFLAYIWSWEDLSMSRLVSPWVDTLRVAGPTDARVNSLHAPLGHLTGWRALSAGAPQHNAKPSFTLAPRKSQNYIMSPAVLIHMTNTSGWMRLTSVCRHSSTSVTSMTK